MQSHYQSDCSYSCSPPLTNLSSSVLLSSLLFLLVSSKYGRGCSTSWYHGPDRPLTPLLLLDNEVVDPLDNAKHSLGCCSVDGYLTG